MDRSYKEDIPKTVRAFEKLKKEFSGIVSATDWMKLRIEPLLEHAKSLERLLRSPKFARETERLRRGVAMFRSDLVYFRENIKELNKILPAERKSRQAAALPVSSRRYWIRSRSRRLRESSSSNSCRRSGSLTNVAAIRSASISMSPRSER
jgi:hypothetical protein